MRNLATYSRLIHSRDDLDSLEDNLRNGADYSNFMKAARVGYLMRQIVRQHITMSKTYQPCQGEQEVAVAPHTTRPPSKLSKMWKRVKRVFIRRERCATDEEVIEEEGNVPASRDAPTVTNILPQQVSVEKNLSPRRHMYSSIEEELDIGGPTYSSIKKGNIQELQMKQKVLAWVEHLDNPNTGALSAALMSVPEKRSKFS